MFNMNYNKMNYNKMRGSNEIDSFGRRRLVTNWIRRKGKKNPLSVEFPNTAICMACGKERYVNTCEFCESCWLDFSHLRGGKIRNGK